MNVYLDEISSLFIAIDCHIPVAIVTLIDCLRTHSLRQRRAETLHLRGPSTSNHFAGNGCKVEFPVDGLHATSLEELRGKKSVTTYARSVNTQKAWEDGLHHARSS